MIFLYYSESSFMETAISVEAPFTSVVIGNGRRLVAIRVSLIVSRFHEKMLYAGFIVNGLVA